MQRTGIWMQERGRKKCLKMTLRTNRISRRDKSKKWLKREGLRNRPKGRGKIYKVRGKSERKWGGKNSVT